MLEIIINKFKQKKTFVCRCIKLGENAFCIFHSTNFLIDALFFSFQFNLLAFCVDAEQRDRARQGANKISFTKKKRINICMDYKLFPHLKQVIFILNTRISPRDML